MKEKRKSVLFQPLKIEYDKTIANTPPRLFPQETDWTCSIACIRTICSALQGNILEENEIVDKFKLEPRPYYSRDIKGISILKDYDAIYGCESVDTTLDTILDYYESGYYIMVECMYNYAHWLVFLGHYAISDYENTEKRQLLFYDPYYNELKLVRADEFVSMWIDGDYANTNVCRDFIAIKNKE